VDDLAGLELRILFESKLIGFCACFAFGMLVHSVYQKKKKQHQQLQWRQQRESEGGEFSSSSEGRFYAVRFRPNTEIKAALEQFVKDNEIRAGGIVSCVGSTAKATLRLSNAKAGNAGPLLETKTMCEIVSFSGTVSSTGGMHVHMSLGDDKGQVIGGHLISALVNTTCELVIVDLIDCDFDRVMDKETGFKEMEVVRTKRFS
jgi:predicted DNA-binding protein with PD1-like motif